MPIRMSPFRELYGYDAITFFDMIFGDCRAPKSKYWVEESQEILKLLKDNLQVAQNQQKQYEVPPLHFLIIWVSYLILLHPKIP